MLRGLAIPESQQRIFQSDAAALEEVSKASGRHCHIGFAVAMILPPDGWHALVLGWIAPASGVWRHWRLSARQPAVSGALLASSAPEVYSGDDPGAWGRVTRFRPKVHVTLWS